MCGRPGGSEGNQDNLLLKRCGNIITRVTYRLLINMSVPSHYSEEEMLRESIVSMIQSRLEYKDVVWSPYRKNHIRKIEKN